MAPVAISSVTRSEASGYLRSSRSLRSPVIPLTLGLVIAECRDRIIDFPAMLRLFSSAAQNGLKSFRFIRHLY